MAEVVSESDLEDNKAVSPKKKEKKQQSVPKQTKKRSSMIFGETKKKSSSSSSATSPAASTQKKPKKDPNAPKKNVSSYLHYTASIRDQMKQENPDASFSEMNKLLGAKFKGLSASERNKWDEKAKQDKIRYTKELEEYMENTPNAVQTPTKPVKDKNQPKKGLSAYNFFVRAKYDKSSGSSFGEQAKLLGDEFKKLSKTERQKWDDMASEDKKRYAREMENYKPSITSPASKSKKAKKDPNAPKKNQNSYIHFGAQVRERIKKKMPN